MLAYQGIFLAATISTASVVLADILVQPGYHYDNNRRNPSHQPVIPQHQPLLPAQQYYAKQLTDQQLMPHLKRVHTIYPYAEYQDYYRSHLVGHPTYHHHHMLPHHLHYTKIGGHGYVRPSIFADYLHPVTGHHRYRRSPVRDTTAEELVQPALVNRDEVATRPSLMEKYLPKYFTVIDSHLQESEPIGTDNKRSEGKRQSKNDRATTGPLLFGLYPENMNHGSHQFSTGSNPTESSDISTNSNIENVLKNSNIKFTANVVKPIQKTSATSQGIGLEKDNKNQQQNQTSLADPNQPSSPTSISSNKASDDKSALIGAAAYNNYYGRELKWPIASTEIYTPLRYEMWNLPSLHNPIYVRNFPDPRPSHVSSKLDRRYQQNMYQVSDKKASLKSRSRNNKERLKTNQLIDVLNPNGDYRDAIFCNTPNYPEYPPIYDVIPLEMHNTYEPIAYSIDPDYYVTYKNSDTQSDPAPTTDIVQTMPQFSSIYDDPVNTRYIALPQTYYHPSLTLTYDSAPFEGTFSSPTYY